MASDAASDMRREHTAVAGILNLLNRIKLILPDGQISNFVSSPLCKNISFPV
jgi:hypothetical protein